VKTQRPIISASSEEEHRVLQFRPRTLVPGPGQHRKSNEAANDLSRYERDREEPDDFRQRMLANVAAFAFTVALLAIGVWLAISIAELRRTQDCVLMGRRDCVRISTPHSWYFRPPPAGLPQNP
jgi:putative hemolysin